MSRGREGEPRESMMNPESGTEYALDWLEGLIVSRIVAHTGVDLEPSLSPAPPHVTADYGIHLARMASQTGQNPAELANKLAASIGVEQLPILESVEAHGPYLNVRLEMGVFGNRVVDQILHMRGAYGKENIGQGKTVVIDMSSPNIAKRMSYGHLRSTIIGDALANLYRVEGYKTIRDNHIGDWGTQFGKLIVAIKRWGDESKLLQSEDPIGELQDLYVRFHEEAELESRQLRVQLADRVQQGGVDAVPGLKETMDTLRKGVMAKKGLRSSEINMETIKEAALDRLAEPSLEREGREWFLRLERGDPEARRLWKICVDLSMIEFNEIYQLLGVSFEETLGESFYEDLLDAVIEEVKNSRAGQISDGALVVDMSDKNLGVSIIQKSDGASVYMTRDLATALYRQREMRADRAIYIVGEDQKLYFQQLFEILRRLGYSIGENSLHVYFGMVRLPEGKMSTRKGRTVFLMDVIEEGLRRTDKVLQEKNPDLYRDKETRERTIRQIAIGALKWNDLSQDPRRPIVFDWDQALNLDGYSAPYVQYSAVRARSILRKAEVDMDGLRQSIPEPQGLYGEKDERTVIRILAEYPRVLTDALRTNNPSRVANYVYDLAGGFNTFYLTTPVLRAPSTEARYARLRLVAATSQVITNGLGILGIEVPEEM